MPTLEIFDVEHGACALLTCDNGARLMIDCGHNASTSWRPGWELAARGVSYLEMLVVTNYDEDHVSGLSNLLEYVNVGSLLRNRTVDTMSLQLLKSEHGTGPGIDALAGMMRTYTGPAGTLTAFPGAQLRVFYNSYGTFDDENNLSLVLWLDVLGLRFLFPGDLETAGWRELLQKNPAFREAVSNVDVLVAAHHGRLSGYCSDLFSDYGCSPQLVVISDEAHQYQTQQMVDAYRAVAGGAPFRGEKRWVLSTRKDGSLKFALVSGVWQVG